MDGPAIQIERLTEGQLRAISTDTSSSGLVAVSGGQDGSACPAEARAEAIRRAAATTLGALYLRGLKRPGRLSAWRWPSVIGALASLSPLERGGPGGDRWTISADQVGVRLREIGMWEEAITLEASGVWAWADDLLGRGEMLTAVCANYPSRWRRILGPQAPPALWRRGEIPAGPMAAVVGSRDLSPVRHSAAQAAGAAVAETGYTLVSGWARGADQAATVAAAEAGGETLSILPYGFDHLSVNPPGAAVSLYPAEQGFSGPQAMERNALIYAASEAALVIAARHGRGGTWTGALDAHRRRLTRLGVWQPSGDCAVDDDPSEADVRRALRAMAGAGMAHVQDLPMWTSFFTGTWDGRSQLGLFGGSAAAQD